MTFINFVSVLLAMFTIKYLTFKLTCHNPYLLINNTVLTHRFFKQTLACKATIEKPLQLLYSKPYFSDDQ